MINFQCQIQTFSSGRKEGWRIFAPGWRMGAMPNDQIGCGIRDAESITVNSPGFLIRGDRKPSH
jgi:hypothetical protein